MEVLSPSIVLAAYAEDLLDGRRVVLFGDATSGVADELAERGARSVHVYDADRSRAAVAAGQNRSKQISVSSYDDADIAVRDGAFDVAIVEDLSTFDDPAALLRQVRRALSSRGAAIVASPNADAKMFLLPRTSAARSGAPLGYYELYDIVSAEFTEVRMLGQTPFVGYAVIDFAPEGEPDVSIDSALLPGGTEEPEWFIALASRDRLDCDPMGIVQLPAHRVASGSASATLSEELRVSRAAEADLLERVAELEVAAAGLRAERDEGGAASVERTSHLERALSQRDALVAELEAKMASADARDQRAREELSSLRQSVEGNDAARQELRRLTADTTRLGSEVGSLTRENAELRAELSSQAQGLAEAGERAERLEAAKAALTAQLEEQRARLAELTEKVTAKDAQIAELTAAAPPGDEPNDLVEMEAALLERGEHIRKLSEELRESERVGRELVRELGHSNGSVALASENAQLKANLEALAWTVQELEGRLSAVGASPR
jgi:SAM-dependent methyltransferase/septal ring factor EnvC (AmiA/AmiB activator)